nr:DNA packaging protein UL32 [Mastomys natalensis cytomegalovirus 3]WEG69888.1 DNA packaging protein UL32 [Mastomys natalensis cytomegalovirus 3]WEG70028.1 DNA packaging protein UL32 [Mastomys natalensis cytomegalovirus 3]WEG70168.1 DNA packaging protein UL32 [Mastomys natalensis cytomegalovirus 3]WEG70308.1 DNA packaging protein UL32 [Mastomys natalensis cytomegalovirus 3]
MYRAWNTAITTIDSSLVNELILHAHPPKIPQEMTEPLMSTSTTSSDDSGRETVDETCDIDAELAKIGDETASEIRELCLPLEIDSRCNLCAIVSICLRRDPEQKWLLDYCYLCRKCAAAPRTSLATLIVATEFLHLMNVHFKDIVFTNIFKERIITIFDFHAHFFINRCFTQRDEHPIIGENITLAHMAVTRALLSDDDAVPYTKKRRIQYKLPKTSKQIEDDGIRALDKYKRLSNGTFTHVLFYLWAGTNIMFNTTLTDLAIKKSKILKTLKSRQSEFELSTGPVYLSPIPTFKLRNSTTTVCLLCELMACSYKDNIFLTNLKEKIMNYSHNNLKIIDRTQLALADVLSHGKNSEFPQQLKNKDVSSYITTLPNILVTSTKPGETETFELNTLTYLILRQVGVIGVYKHLFADPLCAANIRSTDPEILFFDVPNEYLNELKLAICSTNAYPSRVERDFWLYAHMFKAFQTIKRNFKTKTQLADFLKDFTQVLEGHRFALVDPGFIVDKYV